MFPSKVEYERLQEIVRLILHSSGVPGLSDQAKFKFQDWYDRARPGTERDAVEAQATALGLPIKKA